MAPLPQPLPTDQGQILPPDLFQGGRLGDFAVEFVFDQPGVEGFGQGAAVTLTIDRNGQQQQLSIDPAEAVQPLTEPEPPASESTE